MLKDYLSKSITALIFFIPVSVNAAGADVVNVDIENKGDNRFTFIVTVEHADEGWDHYVDRWDILTNDGKLLGVRALRHPHVKEQPFTRNLPNYPVPEEIDTVIIRAHCSVDGYTGKTIEVKLPR